MPTGRCCWCWMPPPARTRLNQAREFQEAAGITGIVLTKLDGTAKGGVVIAMPRGAGRAGEVHRRGRRQVDDSAVPLTPAGLCGRAV